MQEHQGSSDAPGHAAGLGGSVEGAGAVGGANQVRDAGAAAGHGPREPGQALLGVVAGHALWRGRVRVARGVSLRAAGEPCVVCHRSDTHSWKLGREQSSSTIDSALLGATRENIQGEKSVKL